MPAPAFALFALIGPFVLAGVATATPPPAGPPPGAAPGAVARAGGAVPRHGAHANDVHARWYGPGVRFHYGAPYWGGWGWPVYAWPGVYAYGAYAVPGHYGLAYVPPYYVYGPPGVVTATGGVVYIEREAGTVSTQQPAPAPPPPAPEATSAAPPAAMQWWYLCNSPRGAYPYVRECPGGWERVPAVPPGPAK